MSQLQTLLSDASITALLTDGSLGIWYDTVIPDETTDPRDATINYYRIAPVDGGLEYMQTAYSVNCRAGSMEAAEEIATAVHAVVNRYSSGGYHFISSVLSTIPPIDLTDNYNAPVEIKSRARTFT